jgi:DNA-binding response OmpR family regulator
MAERILVVEIDLAVQRALRRLFETAGFEVSVAADGATAEKVLETSAPKAVVLDMDLPGSSGEDLCRRIRSTSPVPILVLSATNDVVSKVLMLELGADDYITKPFSPRELVTRLRVALRRAMAHQEARVKQSYSFDEVEVNFDNMELLRRGKQVPLTPKEFKMLHFFVSNKERVFSRDELLNRVWGYQNYPTTRTVDTHVLRLRKKLERDPYEPVHFQTVHGVGYRFVG